MIDFLQRQNLMTVVTLGGWGLTAAVDRNHHQFTTPEKQAASTNLHDESTRHLHPGDR